MEARLEEEKSFYVIDNPTHQPHDKFFRTAMSDKRVARDFIQSHLPKDMLQTINLDNLVLQHRSYINDVRKETVVDVLFKTTIANKEAFIYVLVEHQSEPDVLMPFRVLKYMVNIMDDHLNKIKKTKKTKPKNLPLIYPIVVYHSDEPYTHSTDILDIVDAPRLLAERYFLKPFHLIDLGKINDEIIKSHVWAGMMEFALKHVFERDIVPWVKEVAGLMRHLVLQGGENYIEVVLEYLFERAEVQTRGEFITLINKEISTEIGEKVMTIAEQYRAEGRQEGRQEGIEKANLDMAKRLLAEKMDPVIIAKVTQLSLNQIKQLEENIH